jgi:hypothetical protein
VDTEAIARGVRRRQAQESLDFEREREQALQDQVGLVIAEVDGPQVDDAAFAAMSAEDVAIVKAELNPLPYEPEDGPDFFERDDLIDFDDAEPVDPHAEELARLNEELVQCRRRQAAFQAYLAALDAPSADELSI